MRARLHDVHRLRNLVVVAGLTGALVAGCGGNAAPVATPTPPAGGVASSTAPPVAPADLKPLLRGLLDRNGVPPAGFEHVMGGYVVNAYWSDLQPQAGGPIAGNNLIDQAIAQVRSENARNGTTWGLRLRIHAGIHAPGWAKQLDGAPVSVTDPHSGAAGTIGRFWTADFGRAYAQLQQALATQYDATPEVRDVTISRCTTVYAEPLIRDASDPASVAALLGAGYTLAADQQCQQEAIEAHSVWQHTRSTLALNPYQVITPAGRGRVDESFTERLMSQCRTVLLARCVLENNSLRTPALGAYAALYSAMQRQGGAISFQTATLDRVGDLNATLDLARQLGATSVEVPAGYARSGSSALAGSAAGLAANAPNS